MHSLYNEEKREGVLSVHAENAYNAVNRKAFFHSVNIICSSIPSFVHNWYSKPTHLFVIGVVEIPSSEGTMQVYPAAIAIYAKIIVSLILIILKSRSTWNNHMELQKHLIIQMTLQQQLP